MIERRRFLGNAGTCDGNIIPNVDRCWNEIAYLQRGDNPGRKEPGTGEMNHRNVIRHVAARSREIAVGMEHGLSLPGREGGQTLPKAYRGADSF